MRHVLVTFSAALALLSAACTPQTRTLHIVTTGDVHGSWFDEPYVDGQSTKTSLMSVAAWVDSLRRAVGSKNVLLLDAGDCLQGDNAAYYYNYVDTLGEHAFVQLTAYMGYDAIAVGNHDIETGHPVYDRIASQLASHGIPFLAANALREEDGEPYFTPYKVFRRGGMKVAVIGFTNPNNPAWMQKSLWSGIVFENLIPCVQEWVDAVREKERPDLVVALTHSGTGEGDGSSLESQGLDLLATLSGVDLLVCSHDHRPFVKEEKGTWLINGGARAGNVGHLEVSCTKGGGRELKGEFVRMDKNRVDAAMKERFRPLYEKVRSFTLRPVGELTMELRTRDAYRGMCDYVNLVHTVQLAVSGAEISFAAPLTYNGTVRSGTVVFNDMFTIYPYENHLHMVRLKGSEIKDYLEYSYDGWIRTPGPHVLKMENNPDPRTGSDKWSFVGRTYNFDSAAGLVYTVDVTRPFGNRVRIQSLADGRAFDPGAWYDVAMTSYRASGGGDLLIKATGISSEELISRTSGRFPEIRELIYRFFMEHGRVDAALIGDRALLGEWHFVPEKIVGPLMEKDLALIF